MKGEKTNDIYRRNIAPNIHASKLLFGYYNSSGYKFELRSIWTDYKHSKRFNNNRFIKKITFKFQDINNKLYFVQSIIYYINI